MSEDKEQKIQERKFSKVWISAKPEEFIGKVRSLVACLTFQIILVLVFNILSYIWATSLIKGVENQSDNVGGIFAFGVVGAAAFSIVFFIIWILNIVFLVKSMGSTKRYLEEASLLNADERNKLGIWLKKVQSLRTSLVAKAVFMVIELLIFFLTGNEIQTVVLIVNLGIFIWICINYSGLKSIRNNFDGLV